MDLAKYQKVKVVLFGLLLPTLLLAYTVLLLLSGEVVFWAHSATIIYHSNEAYFLSLLWFGASGCMYSYFLLRPLKLFSHSKRKLILNFSTFLLCVGLLAAIFLV
ncbi:hypothetical protein GCM10009092_32890 [Bowmanella denitrificans]|uniref:Uncharacterized protein n=1 Tax=Bowmanella denitrificans TaxID=366582 RepID=A0ABN0XJZ0_9ALTE